MTQPVCPVTGQPATRLVQWVDSRFLSELWRLIFRVDARSSFGVVERFGLWQSPTGLYFFDPMTEGNNEFYTQFYARVIERKLWSRDAIRKEFEYAARWIKPGDRVLDVGCGFAGFRHAIPDASYTGLDPNFAAESGVKEVSDQTLAEHLEQHSGHYDAVCAFQVIEHLASPAMLFAEMVRAARPGGLVIVGVPKVPSALTRIPNFLINAPPHHLTWWTAPALHALAAQCEALVETIEPIPWSRDEALIYWAERCSPIHCTDSHYRHAWSWHAATLIGYVGARLMTALGRMPSAADEGISLLMVARRPPHDMSAR